MVYEVEDPPPGEIIVVEAKGGSSPLGSRKIGNEAYQQGTAEYAAAIIGEMSKHERGTTERKVAKAIRKASRRGCPIRYIHTQSPISVSGKVSKVRVNEFKVDLGGR
jgi:hypothetical protein